MKLHVFLLAAVLSLAAVNANSEPRFGGPGMGFGNPARMLEHMADHLDLDDAQRASIENIIEASRPELEAMREQFKANRKALEALDVNDAAYSAELNNIALSNGELATQGTLIFSQLRADVAAVLTEEQQAKLERAKERFKDRAQRRGKRQAD